MQSPLCPFGWASFGTCQTLDCGARFGWFTLFIRYLKENDPLLELLPLNGAQSSGEGRKYDAVETYGLLAPDYRQMPRQDRGASATVEASAPR